MRLFLALSVAATMVASGCASSTEFDPAFLAAAAQAPTLLTSDMGTTGTLSAVEGSMSMTMSMHMEMGGQAHDVTTKMDMDMHQQFFEGGAMRMVMDMNGMEMNGKAMPGMEFSMTVFCSPTKIVLQSDGMPDGKDMDITVENTSGTCADPSGLADQTFDGVDPSITSQLKSMLDQTKVPEMRFSHALREGGQDYAVYDTTIDFGGSEMAMTFTIQTRATLSGDRISFLDMTGTGDLDLSQIGQGMTAHIDMMGDQSYTYGVRGPVPAEFA